LGTGDESQACVFVITIKITDTRLFAITIIGFGSKKAFITVTLVGNGLELIDRDALLSK
jgi:hypothetical protein